MRPLESRLTFRIIVASGLLLIIGAAFAILLVAIEDLRASGFIALAAPIAAAALSAADYSQSGVRQKALRELPEHPVVVHGQY